MWEEPYRETVHAMLLLARDWQKGEALSATVWDVVVPSLTDIAQVLEAEQGHVLRNNEAQAQGKDESAAKGEGSRKGQPIEHFGYVDGRSQPLFLKSDIDKEEGGMDRWDPTAPLSLVLVPDPYGQGEDSYGSYFVFRKLEQDVAAFNEGINALAAHLNVHPDLAGALAVGRFKDGTPVTLQRMPGLRDVNNFEYESIDREGNRCPAHAHIRKVNPRGTTPLTQRQDERKRRIVRRGIPYGAPETSPVGLLFMCYQSDIRDQFEFMQRTWADNPNFPDALIVARTGDDPIIGQDTDDDADQQWPTHWGRPDEVSFNFGGYVTLRGGEYFFAPSISFLRTL
jgi:Dyp-type peroxidase family